jgi:hypothetical protein
LEEDTKFKIKGSNLVTPYGDDQICVLQIQKGDDSTGIILGDPFLRSYYSVYNLETGEIGLATSSENNVIDGITKVNSNTSDGNTLDRNTSKFHVLFFLFIFYTLQ